MLSNKSILTYCKCLRRILSGKKKRKIRKKSFKKRYKVLQEILKQLLTYISVYSNNNRKYREMEKIGM